MQTDYTDDHTAHARELERSSAGYQTQPLTPLPNMPAPSAGRLNPLGLALMLLGGCMLVVYLLTSLGGVSILPALPLPSRGEIQAGLILLTIGSCFMFFAFWQRIYPLIIPGCVLLGLSVGVPLAALTHGASVLWGLAFGFLCVFLLGRTMFRKWGRTLNWPVIPAVVLFAIGMIIVISSAPAFLLGGVALIPLVLIVAGLLLGAARRP